MRTPIEPRIVAAVFGLLGPESLTEAAGSITVPIRFPVQSDEPAGPHFGTGLFDAFASSAKTLHTNPAAHYRGRPFGFDSSARFFFEGFGRPPARRADIAAASRQLFRTLIGVTARRPVGTAREHRHTEKPSADQRSRRKRPRPACPGHPRPVPMTRLWYR